MMIYSSADMWLKPAPCFYAEGSVCYEMKFFQNLVCKAEAMHIHLFFLKDFHILKIVAPFETMCLCVWRLSIQQQFHSFQQ